eukprot:1253012-Rhodomonas_salina.7
MQSTTISVDLYQEHTSGVGAICLGGTELRYLSTHLMHDTVCCARVSHVISVLTLRSRLRACYAMPSTEVGYQGDQLLPDKRALRCLLITEGRSKSATMELQNQIQKERNVRTLPTCTRNAFSCLSFRGCYAFTTVPSPPISFRPIPPLYRVMPSLVSYAFGKSS